MAPFAKTKTPFMLAARRRTTLAFGAVAKDVRIGTKDSNFGDARWDGATVGRHLRILEIQLNDYHWYEAELARVGLTQPAQLFKVLPPQGQASLDSATKAQWEGMVRVMEILAASCAGILFRGNGDALTLVDFAEPT